MKPLSGTAEIPNHKLQTANFKTTIPWFASWGLELVCHWVLGTLSFSPFRESC
jgi:hypothetical protein